MRQKDIKKILHHTVLFCFFYTYSFRPTSKIYTVLYTTLVLQYYTHSSRETCIYRWLLYVFCSFVYIMHNAYTVLCFVYHLMFVYLPLSWCNIISFLLFIPEWKASIWKVFPSLSSIMCWSCRCLALGIALCRSQCINHSNPPSLLWRYIDVRAWLCERTDEGSTLKKLCHKIC